MAERSLLALSYAYPPIALPEAHLSAKRLANLPGWKADVVAAARFHDKIAHDAELLPFAQSHVASVTRVAPAFPEIWRYLNILCRVPDGFRLLNGKVVAAAEARHIGSFDAMLSWSQYHSIHLAAARIKARHPRLPWVAHFSDPWVDNPFSILKGALLAINRSLERSVMQAADRILFTTPETSDLVMAKYPPAWRSKVRVIPHGYEPSLYSGARSAPRGGRPAVFRYLGNFYGARTPRPLYLALAEALRRRPAFAQALRVEIYGSSEMGMDGSGGVALPQGLVSFHPAVGYRHSLHLMETADALLVIDAPMEKSVFLPSKLVDYLGAGRPVIALTPDGASARVLRELDERVVSPGDTAAAATALLQTLDSLGEERPPPRGRERYSAATTGAEFAAVLNELVA